MPGKEKSQVIGDAMMGNMTTFLRVINLLKHLGMDWGLGGVGIRPVVGDTFSSLCIQC